MYTKKVHLINWRLHITLSHRRSRPYRRPQTANVSEVIVSIPSIPERFEASYETRPDASVNEEKYDQQNNQNGKEHRSDFVTVAPAIDSIKHFTINGTDAFRIKRIVCIFIVIGGVLLSRTDGH